MKVLEYIQSESDRQKASLRETIDMVEAWKYVAGFGGKMPNLETIQHVAFLITGLQGYRQTPAVFDQGPPALDAGLIPRSMANWHMWLHETNEFSPRQIDLIMREFLEIHPFADGNGRVASLLYNYFLGTI